MTDFERGRLVGLMDERCHFNQDSMYYLGKKDALRELQGRLNIGDELSSSIEEIFNEAVKKLEENSSTTII